MDVKNEAFPPLLAELKVLLRPYAERLTVRKDEPGYFELWSRGTQEIDFCFMPLYADQKRGWV